MAISGEDRLDEEPPPRKPRGARSRHEVERDLERVEKMLRQGTPTYAIKAKLARGAHPLASRSVDRYIAEVRERWKRELLLRSETAREERLAELRETRAALWNDRKPIYVDGQLKRGARYDATIARYDEMINELLGVGGPAIEVKHSGQVATLHVHVDYSKLDEKELDALEQAALKLDVTSTISEGGAAPAPGAGEPGGDRRGDPC